MNNDEWMKEAEALIREYGAAKYDTGFSCAMFARRDERYKQAEAEAVFDALLSHLHARPLPAGEVDILQTDDEAGYEELKAHGRAIVMQAQAPRVQQSVKPSRCSSVCPGCVDAPCPLLGAPRPPGYNPKG